MPRIATHKQPDADALAALYLAERFLYAGEIVTVVFVSRGATRIEADCVVDVGNIHDPDRLRFDHKPPALPDRNQSCATRLLWEYLVDKQKLVAHLAAWVEVVHEGDANPPRSPSPALRQSRTEGFHATVAGARQLGLTDAAVYNLVRGWLDANLRNQENNRLLTRRRSVSASRRQPERYESRRIRAQPSCQR